MWFRSAEVARACTEPGRSRLLALAWSPGTWRLVPKDRRWADLRLDCGFASYRMVTRHRLHQRGLNFEC